MVTEGSIIIHLCILTCLCSAVHGLKTIFVLNVSCLYCMTVLTTLHKNYTTYSGLRKVSQRTSFGVFYFKYIIKRAKLYIVIYVLKSIRVLAYDLFYLAMLSIICQQYNISIYIHTYISIYTHIHIYRYRHIYIYRCRYADIFTE